MSVYLNDLCYWRHSINNTSVLAPQDSFADLKSELCVTTERNVCHGPGECPLLAVSFISPVNEASLQL